MGRYTLNVEALGIKKPVLVKENGVMREKVSLTSIDALTLGSTPLAVLKELDFEHAKFYSQGKLYISYISNRRLRKMKVLYNDLYGLRSIALLGNNKIELDNKEFNSFIDNVFIPMLKDFKFMQFLKDNNFLSPKLDEYIGYLYGRKYDEKYCIKKIKEHASSYSMFRKLVMAVGLFKKMDFNKAQVTEEEREPDNYFGLYSPEELEEYQEYMDNLPDSFDVHTR